MRTQILIKRKMFVWLLLLLLGLFFLFSGIEGYNKYKNAAELETLDMHHLEAGTYVSGNIGACVKKNMAEAGPEEYSGVGHVYVTFGKEYDIYTIPVAEHSYIRVMAGDADTKLELEKMMNRAEKTVYFEGEIVKSPLDVNYAWYHDIEEFDVDSLETGYMIKQKKIGETYKRIYPGIAILCLCVYLLFCGSLKDAVTRETLYVESY